MRVLVVFEDPMATESAQNRCAPLIAGGHEIAVCYVLPAGAGLRASLDAQRKITMDLRRAFGASAEAIPVFVISGLEGDTVDECARAWGATDVQR